MLVCFLLVPGHFISTCSCLCCGGPFGACNYVCTFAWLFVEIPVTLGIGSMCYPYPSPSPVLGFPMFINFSFRDSI
ncbi:hypothetical protein DFJ58DRAFT_816056 [Suillus subalutaceus]|uniref:uncharacterized protein n=1 Tax=Suillus subalutaceus TaxID=48586 RepID=UPI001B85B851|nr:uncharacterized protein DFJ58DRAFT_816056 [Suillus subalutaceus]KAG1837312.1 hypothetical protein DFJ58DRAFT_816056 [Suillus subalutaceus]